MKTVQIRLREDLYGKAKEVVEKNIKYNKHQLLQRDCKHPCKLTELVNAAVYEYFENHKII